MTLSTDRTTAEIASTLAARRGATSVVLAGAGTEFLFYEATVGNRREGYRIPRSVEFNTANNRGVLAETLQRQEMALARWASSNGIPGAAATDLVIQDGFPILILEVVDDDGSELDSAALGSVIAAMHSAPCPDFRLVAQDGKALAGRITQRVNERYTELRKQHSLPNLPSSTALRATLESSAGEPCLTHMDLRRQNVRVHNGQPLSLFDWSNALFAPPELEIARIEEYSAIRENGLDYSTFLKGYTDAGGSIDNGGASSPVFNLDAAVMLAGVFNSFAPDPELREHFLSRIRALVGAL
ncbi:phosphotransferase family protein [Arthrobacter sp. 18067]|uniref:phosphotransferase family protein n=1 Tax=Arthrobacter sp. 18067 TaxID=2681413 RepID=UPI0013585F70|nr:phosphotransferase [Arthrobacter sp. 18067]